MPTQQLDQSKLFEVALREGAAAFEAAIAKFHSEHFYAFCFCADNDITSIYPIANTVEGFERVCPKEENTDPTYYKWVPAEWQLDFGQFDEQNLMSHTSQLLAPDYAHEHEESTEAFHQRKRQTITTLSRALLAIRESGIFEQHTAQKRLAFWVDFGDVMDDEVDWILQPIKPHVESTDFEELRSPF